MPFNREASGREAEAFVAVGDLVAQEAQTLEVRWLRRGGLAARMIEWFSPFVEELETREDTYLGLRDVGGVSLKLRGGLRLEIKYHTGDEGVLDLPGHAQGRTQPWKKWSIPIAMPHEIDFRPPDWIRVEKHRQLGWFSVARGLAVARRSGPVNGETTCAVELTEVLKRGDEPWWTLGFEAAGPPATLKEAIEATAALLFRNFPPEEPELRMTESMSYSEWLQLPD